MRLNPSMVVAGIALAAAVAGTATATDHLITSADIQNNTIRSVDVRDNTLRSRDIRDGTVRRRDLHPSARPTPGPRGPAGPPGPAGSPTAFLYMDETGALDVSQSSTDRIVGGRAEVAVYCISPLDFRARSAVATQAISPTARISTEVTTSECGGTPERPTVRVSMRDHLGVPTPSPFTVWIAG